MTSVLTELHSKSFGVDGGDEFVECLKLSLECVDLLVRSAGGEGDVCLQLFGELGFESETLVAGHFGVFRFFFGEARPEFRASGFHAAMETFCTFWWLCERGEALGQVGGLLELFGEVLVVVIQILFNLSDWWANLSGFFGDLSERRLRG